MNCKKCGNVLAPTDMVCSNCGEPVNNIPLNQMNSQTSSQPLNSSMNFQNTLQQSQNFHESMSTQNMNDISVNPNMQQPMEQSFSQNSNAQFNNMINSQDMYTEQSVNQNNSIQQPEVKKKKSYLFIIIVVALVLIIGVLGYFVVFKKLLKGNNGNNTASDNSSITEQTTQVTNTNNYSYKNFEFPIPNSYVASEDAELGSLNLVNKTDKVLVGMLIHQYVTIDDYQESLDEIKSELTSQGLKISSQSSKSFSGVNWIILYCSMTSEGKTVNFLETFASLGNYHVLEIAIANYGDKSDETIIKDLSNMISNTTYKGTNNFSSSDKKETPSADGDFKFDESIFE